MPILLIVYVLMLVDKNSISYANIMGIREDVGLDASEFSWLGSIV
jgi:ACS family allantoate permease-like MFS transporter